MRGAYAASDHPSQHEPAPSSRWDPRHAAVPTRPSTARPPSGPPDRSAQPSGHPNTHTPHEFELVQLCRRVALVNLAHGATGSLVVRTVPVTEPLDLLTRLPDPSALAWVRHGEGIVGWGEAARVVVPGGDENRFTWADTWLRELFG